MTVNTELARAEADWTGVETAFAPGFPADKVADVLVLYRTPAGVITTLTAGVNYSVTLASGSKIVTVLPIAMPAAPGKVVMRRKTPALVSETLQDGEGFSLAIIQQLHDKAAMRSGEDRDTFARAIVLAEGAALGEGNFDLGGSGLDNLAPGQTPNSAATVSQLVDLIVAAGNVPPPLLGDVARFLVATGAGTYAWLALALALAQIPDGLFTADAAGLAKFADGFLTADAAGRAKLADKLVTLAKIADVSTAIMLGRKTAGTGVLEELSAGDVRGLIAGTVGQALLVAADDVAARLAILAPPAPKTGSGIGQWLPLSAPSGNGLTLPAGGTWVWFAAAYASSGTNWAAGFTSGVSAGGTIITSPTPGSTWTGIAWRIA